MTFQRLWPAGPDTGAAELLREVRAGERAGAERPFVFVNMIVTLDGRAALDGRTSALGDAADLELLLELRAMADAVLIGTGTLRAEGYDRLVRSPVRRARRKAAGLAEDPLAVVLSRTLDLPWKAGLFQAREQPVLAYTVDTAPEPPDVPAPVDVVRLPQATPEAALADLRRRGVRALLCEGGPTLHGALLAAGLVDELFLTLAPLATGEETAPRIVEGGSLPAPLRFKPRWVVRSGDELFLRYGL